LALAVQVEYQVAPLQHQEVQVLYKYLEALHFLQVVEVEEAQIVMVVT
jgi:hypothetical protein